jgi:hypothetical protein
MGRGGRDGGYVKEERGGMGHDEGIVQNTNKEVENKILDVVWGGGG